MPSLIVIGGPTASGKTSLAIKIARRLQTVIINADSRQFYQEMRIGNARPDKEELAAAQHYFIADRSVKNPLSAGSFAREALALLEQLFQQHHEVVLVGGSGLYIKALCEGLDEFPPVTEAVKQKVRELTAKGGAEQLYEALRSVDPEYADLVDPHNERRLSRALEVSWSAGQPYSSFRQQKVERSFSCRYYQPKLGRLSLNEAQQKLPPRMQITPERNWLYERIDRRVDIMLRSGLKEEARKLYELRHLPALNTVGYQEFWPYFAGEYDLDRAVELIKRNSRRYAKRQMTWFKGDGRYQEISDY